MALHLVELVLPEGSTPDGFESGARTVVAAAGGSVVETTFAADLERLYVIVEIDRADPLAGALQAAGYRVHDVAPVRRVGDGPAAGAPSPSHLVEWDLPGELKMDQYLERKAAKTPLYAKVPEVRFLRTYVREDMIKCVCLYEAPDESAVRRAREAVGAPVDRLSRLARSSDDD